MIDIYTLERQELVTTLINQTIVKGGPITGAQFKIVRVENIPATKRSLVTIEGIGNLVGSTSIQVAKRSFRDIIGTNTLDIYIRPINLKELLKEINIRYRINIEETDIADTRFDFTKDKITLSTSNESILYVGDLNINFKHELTDLSTILPAGIAAKIDVEDVPEGKLNASYLLQPIDVSNLLMHLHTLRPGDLVGVGPVASIEVKVNSKSPRWITQEDPADYNLHSAVVVVNETYVGTGKIMVLKLDDVKCTNYSGLIGLIYK